MLFKYGESVFFWGGGGNCSLKEFGVCWEKKQKLKRVTTANEKSINLILTI